MFIKAIKDLELQLLERRRTLRPPAHRGPKFPPLLAREEEVKQRGFLRDATFGFVLTIGSFLHTSELLCLQLCLGAFLLTIGVFYIPLELFCLQLKLFCLQWEHACTKHIHRLWTKKLNCKQKAPTVSKKAPPGFSG